MNNGTGSTLGLDDLLENDLSSYELFYSLPREVQRKAAQKDIRSFSELSAFANAHRNSDLG